MQQVKQNKSWLTNICNIIHKCIFPKNPWCTNVSTVTFLHKLINLHLQTTKYICEYLYIYLWISYKGRLVCHHATKTWLRMLMGHKDVGPWLKGATWHASEKPSVFHCTGNLFFVSYELWVRASMDCVCLLSTSNRCLIELGSGDLEVKSTLWTLCHVPQTIPKHFLQCCRMHNPAERSQCHEGILLSVDLCTWSETELRYVSKI